MNIRIRFATALLCLFSLGVRAELTPLLVPTLDPATSKYTGKSVVADSIDNQSQSQPFRDRIYHYDLALDANGKAYVLYASPKPAVANSSAGIDYTNEKSDIILAIETDTGWSKTTLTTEGLYKPAALQIKMDAGGTFHLIYVRKLTKKMAGTNQVVDYLVYRTISNGVVSAEKEVGNLDANPANFAGLGGWRTRLAIGPNNSVYMLREGANTESTKPQFNLLIPDGKGNWNMTTLTGLASANWFHLAEFLIDSKGRGHIAFGDFAYNSSGQAYVSNGSASRDDFGFHNLWYASSNTLDGKGWSQTQLKEDPATSVPALFEQQFWTTMTLDDKDNPAVTTWAWKVGTAYPGNGTPNIFFYRSSDGSWNRVQTTRTFENLSYQPKAALAGMGAGIIKDASGWHGVWDSSHPRPFEHESPRGGLQYQFSPDGKNWNSYQVLQGFSAEGSCLVRLDKQGRLNILVLGDYTDTQLYLLRYQLPGNNLMEIYPDRRFYYTGESVTIHARVQSAAVGDFYVVAVSKARPEISQPSEIWQLTSNLSWQNIESLGQLRPVLTLPASGGLDFHNTLGQVGTGQQPFNRPDTDYTVYSLVVKPGASLFDSQQWVTPLFARELIANKTLP